jgi:CIC family chloride channel protein
MTSVLMIFETTHDYAVIVPLMISNLVSFFISTRLQPTPIYKCLAIQDGIHLPSENERRRSHQRQAAHVMRAAKETLKTDETVKEAAGHTRGSPFHAWPLIDEQGVVGMRRAKRANSCLSSSMRTVFRTCMRTIRCTLCSNGWGLKSWISCPS